MNMNTTIIIPINKQDKERLSRLAIRYGFSLPEFSRLVLKELASEIPAESFNDYASPKSLRSSFNRALRDYRTGKIHTKL